MEIRDTLHSSSRAVLCTGFPAPPQPTLVCVRLKFPQTYIFQALEQVIPSFYCTIISISRTAVVEALLLLLPFNASHSRSSMEKPQQSPSPVVLLLLVP